MDYWVAGWQFGQFEPRMSDIIVGIFELGAIFAIDVVDVQRGERKVSTILQRKCAA